jgi:hypothetical protein
VSALRLPDAARCSNLFHLLQSGSFQFSGQQPKKSCLEVLIRSGCFQHSLTIPNSNHPET